MDKEEETKFKSRHPVQNVTETGRLVHCRTQPFLSSFFSLLLPAQRSYIIPGNIETQNRRYTSPKSYITRQETRWYDFMGDSSATARGSPRSSSSSTINQEIGLSYSPGLRPIQFCIGLHPISIQRVGLFSSISNYSKAILMSFFISFFMTFRAETSALWTLSWPSPHLVYFFPRYYLRGSS